jgi:ABC-type Fe3+ transport system substrate-binding protein
VTPRFPVRPAAFATLLGLLLLAGTAGCTRQAPDTVRLKVLSPHRDEIREEIALGFQDWFRQRSLDRLDAARAALAGADRKPAEQALAAALEDWHADDLPDLYAAYRSWREQPGAQQRQDLLAALEQTAANLPRVELAWQDVGGGTTQIERYVNAQFGLARDKGEDGIGIDLVFGGGTDIFLRLAARDKLQPVALPPALLARIPSELNGVPVYDPRGRWYGPVLSSFGILCNRRVLERIGQPEPQRWQDLGRPGLQGWVTAGDPRLTGSVHMVYEIILQADGWDEGMCTLLRLGANAHSFIRDSGTLTRAIITGEVAAGGNLDANALSAVGRDPEGMAFHLPQRETIINPDALAVLAGAPRPGLARAFVEFNLSDAGQRLYLLRPGVPGGPRRYPLCRLSVVKELYDRYPPSERSVGDANPFAVRGAIRYDSKLGGRRWDALNDLVGAVIVDAHADLAAAWRAVLHGSLPEEERQRLEAELFRPPCTEAELLTHAGQIVEDSPRVRTATVNRWGEEARQRYRRVRAAAEVR